MQNLFRPANRWRLVASTVVLAALAGCGSSGEAPQSATLAETSSSVPAGQTAESSALLSVVVSDPPLADLVRRVGGSRVDVRTVVPVGADSHTYEPLPSDARALAEADLFVENGMNLNPVVTAFAMSNYPQGTPHHALADVIPPEEVISTDSQDTIASHGHAHNFNAHFWPDPIYAMAYVERIEQILSQADPPGASEYGQRRAELIDQLEAVHEAFGAAIATIPEANRKLVVYHDSWSYFGRRYDMPVIGAIQPTDFSEPSAAELRDLIAQVRIHEVPAFFGSEVFPSDVLGVVEAETGSDYVADLSDDALPGEAGSPEHGYVGMMVANVRSIVAALGGDPAALDPVDPAES